MLAILLLAWSPCKVSFTSQFGSNNLAMVLGKTSIDDKPWGASKLSSKSKTSGLKTLLVMPPVSPHGGTASFTLSLLSINVI